MKTKISLVWACVFAISSLGWTSVWAEDYEEVSYESLLNQLQSKTKPRYNQNSEFDGIMIHAGFGLITGMSTVRTGETDSYKFQNGFQMSLGIDLFDPQWEAETSLRNFGRTNSGTETRSLREFSMKLLYKNRTSDNAGFRIGAGIGNRYLRIADDQNNIFVDDNTPVSVFSAGVDSYTSKNFSIGFEVGLKTALVTRTIDKNAVDMGLRFDTHF